MNSIIKLSNVKVDYNTPIIKGNGISVIWFDSEVYLEGDKIKFRVVTELESKDGSNKFHGYWTTTKWVYHYIDSPKTIYNGREKYFYDFAPNDSTYKYGWDYIDGEPWPPCEFTNYYSYDLNRLILKNQHESYDVQFKNSKMYWYIKWDLLKNSINRESIKQRITPWCIENY